MELINLEVGIVSGKYTTYVIEIKTNEIIALSDLSNMLEIKLQKEIESSKIQIFSIRIINIDLIKIVVCVENE